jgi:hypothetical protein
MQVANLLKSLCNSVQFELYVTTCVNPEFRVQRQAAELECRYTTLSINRDLKYSNGSVATRKLQSVVRTC